MRSDINVTPLVDVCLVLLIIFMAVNDKLQRGLDVPLPKSRYHASPRDDGQPIVSIAADGSIYWDANASPAPASSPKSFPRRRRERRNS